MKTLNNNKKAYYEYTILDEYECGLVLLGSEIKPIKNGKSSIKGSYCYIQNNEIFIKDMYIGNEENTVKYNSHDEYRVKKLLLHKKEISKISKSLSQKGLTIVPLDLHITSNGFLKLKIGLAKGKNLFDKRNSLKKKDVKRDLQIRNNQIL
jgi:SsrA-binding protein